ncbi:MULTISPECIES: hypothetical protein [unclassified Bacillus (in: firmicutes)]|jgi:hypothetical protein|nr:MULTISPECIES: hypothetical protein [unclassified Bacillus (in: firmicutes)]MBT2614025.1 hypothetical protein [Bacillus sp. ISL-78]MBT2629464.1 hypothetical protein [Bacillus sp. ISL-101]
MARRRSSGIDAVYIRSREGSDLVDPYFHTSESKKRVIRDSLYTNKPVE